MLVVELLFWMSFAIVAYVYVGYPVLLSVLAAATRYAPVRDDGYEPPVTLVVSAYNEAEVIGKKLRNCEGIDYPKHKLEILVVSDASDDGTDEVVTGEGASNVRLLRMPVRSGKTAGLNEALSISVGTVVVFSDANAMYAPDAIRNMIRNFGDKTIGAVVGESTYAAATDDAGKSESVYWRYETTLKRLESRLGSVVGGDGAIYGIRRKLYRPMALDALSDFVNPCQIIEQGYRCVYEQSALSVEESAGSFAKEFQRKVRIVNRAWRATMSMKHLLNPFRYGLFAIMLLSHKVLRWLVPAFLVTALLSNAILALESSFFLVVLLLQGLFYTLAVVGAMLRHHADLPFFVYLPYYFCLVNLASAKGILEAYMGKTYTTWSTARADR